MDRQNHDRPYVQCILCKQIVPINLAVCIDGIYICYECYYTKRVEIGR